MGNEWLSLSREGKKQNSRLEGTLANYIIIIFFHNYFKRLKNSMTKLTISSAGNKIPLPLFSGTLLYMLDFFFKLF